MKRAAWVFVFLAGTTLAQTVAGTITNANTQEGIGGASVLLIKPQSRGTNATTDQAGNFRIANVAPGDYIVLAMHAGFNSGPAPAAQVHVEAGGDPEPLRIALRPWPRLSGRVLDAERHPVGKVQVTAIPMSGGVPIPPIQSDAEGRYAFPALPPATYALLATPADPKGDLAPTYFPSAAVRWDGERIHAAVGAELAGYDIVLHGGPFFRVSGRVVDENGRPGAGAAVRLHTVDATYGTATSGEDGTFTMEHVPAVAGRITAQWKRGGAELRGFAAVAVARHDVENVMVRLTPPVVLAGTVELDGKVVAPGMNAFAALAPVEDAGQRVTGILTASGFRFDDAYPGRYKLFFIPMRRDDAYVDAVLLGERDITMREFEVTPGMPPVRVILRTDGGRVTGTVDKSVLDASVFLIPQEERLRVQPFLLDALFLGNGHFEVTGVRPGDYYAVAVSGVVQIGDLQNPEVLAALMPQGTTIHVERKETKSVDLKFVPGLQP